MVIGYFLVAVISTALLAFVGWQDHRTRLRERGMIAKPARSISDEAVTAFEDIADELLEDRPVSNKIAVRHGVLDRHR